MKYTRLFIFGLVFVCYCSITFAKSSRDTLYDDPSLKKLVMFSMQILLQDFKPAKNASLSQAAIILKIKECQNEVISSDTYLSARVHQMKLAATPYEDAAISDFLTYANTAEGRLYLKSADPRLTQRERQLINEKLAKNTLNSKVVSDLNVISLLTLRTGNLNEMQKEFLKRKGCKNYDLSKLVPEQPFL